MGYPEEFCRHSVPTWAGSRRLTGARPPESIYAGRMEAVALKLQEVPLEPGALSPTEPRVQHSCQRATRAPRGLCSGQVTPSADGQF